MPKPKSSRKVTASLMRVATVVVVGVLSAGLGEPLGLIITVLAVIVVKSATSSWVDAGKEAHAK